MTETKKNTKADDQMTDEDYERLLDQYHLSDQELSAGTVVKGRVVKKTPGYLLLDIGHKTEGAIPVEDFRDPKEFEDIKVGSEIEALLENQGPRMVIFSCLKES